MANHEQDGVTTGQGDDWLSEAMGAEAPAVVSVESTPQTGEIGSATETVEVQASEPEKVAATRDRDEHGRFRAKSQEQPVAAEPQTQVETPVEAAAQDPAATQPPAKEDDGAQIPSWRMREIREARDAERARADRAEQDARQAMAAAQQLQQHLAAMQRQMQQLQNPPKQPEPIDLFGDNGPERLLGTVEERFAQQQAAFQRELRNVRLESN
ncbi:MAG TPA: hypothetical protein VEB21_20010, partial [Terriglobales bacterium]|nr:hypothetical protein [Terriglobales bacterium]